MSNAINFLLIVIKFIKYFVHIYRVSVSYTHLKADNKRLIAFVVSSYGENEMKANMRKYLPEYFIPDKIMVCLLYTSRCV